MHQFVVKFSVLLLFTLSAVTAAPIPNADGKDVAPFSVGVLSNPFGGVVNAGQDDGEESGNQSDEGKDQGEVENQVEKNEYEVKIERKDGENSKEGKALEGESRSGWISCTPLRSYIYCRGQLT